MDCSDWVNNDPEGGDIMFGRTFVQAKYFLFYILVNICTYVGSTISMQFVFIQEKKNEVFIKNTIHCGKKNKNKITSLLKVAGSLRSW